jgi:hypothetical protein
MKRAKGRTQNVETRCSGRRKEKKNKKKKQEEREEEVEDREGKGH